MIPRMSPVQLRMLIAQASGLLVHHNAEEARRAVEKIIGALPTTVSMADIAVCVAAKHGITVEQLKMRGSTRAIARPRQEAMWAMRQVRWRDGPLRYSLPQIGRFFGGFDHTTVLHAVRAHQKRIDRHAAVGMAAE